MAVRHVMDFVKGADLPRTRASVRRLDRCAIGRVRVKGFRVPGATGVWWFPTMTWLGPYAASRGYGPGVRPGIQGVGCVLNVGWDIGLLSVSAQAKVSAL